MKTIALAICFAATIGAASVLNWRGGSGLLEMLLWWIAAVTWFVVLFDDAKPR
jgi:hypothetical protein